MRTWQRRTSAGKDSARETPCPFGRRRNIKRTCDEGGDIHGGFPLVRLAFTTKADCPQKSGKGRIFSLPARAREFKGPHRLRRRLAAGYLRTDKVRRKAKQRKGGFEGKGVVAVIVARISGVSARAAGRVLPECAGGGGGIRK